MEAPGLSNLPKVIQNVMKPAFNPHLSDFKALLSCCPPGYHNIVFQKRNSNVTDDSLGKHIGSWREARRGPASELPGVVSESASSWVPPVPSMHPLSPGVDSMGLGA